MAEFGRTGGGNPRDFMMMASELVNLRTKQGKGKTVTDKASFGSSGNPKTFLKMASELRGQFQDQSSR